MSTEQQSFQQQVDDMALGNSCSDSFLLSQLTDSGCEGLIDMFLGAGYDFAVLPGDQQQQQQLLVAAPQQPSYAPSALTEPKAEPFVAPVHAPPAPAAAPSKKRLRSQPRKKKQQQQQQQQRNSSCEDMSDDSMCNEDFADDACFEPLLLDPLEAAAAAAATAAAASSDGGSVTGPGTESPVRTRGRGRWPSGKSDGGDGSTGSTVSKRAMTSDEKAEASRDRNRKHARNTRLRKKAYIEELERTVQALTAERDAAAAAARAAAARAAALRAARFGVLQRALYHRASGCVARAEWAAALEETFTCVLPVTPYRAFPPAEAVSGQRVIAGIDAMIADVASLAVLVASIGRGGGGAQPEGRGEGSGSGGGARTRIQYYAGPEDAIVSGDALSCRWMLRTENAVAAGARCECHAQGMLRARFSPAHKLGMLRARFSPAHKLVHLEIAFDVMGFIQQLQRASGAEEFRVIPNTLAMAQAPSDEARFVVTADAPHVIVHVSPAWTAACGYAADEAVGRTPALLQGPLTDAAALARFMEGVRRRHAAAMDVVNYTKAGAPFAARVVAYPLVTDGRVMHYLAALTPGTAALPAAAEAAAAPAAAAAAAPAAAAAAPRTGAASAALPPLLMQLTSMVPMSLPVTVVVAPSPQGAAAEGDGNAANGFRRRKPDVPTLAPAAAAAAAGQLVWP